MYLLVEGQTCVCPKRVVEMVAFRLTRFGRAGTAVIGVDCRIKKKYRRAEHKISFVLA